jgi:hypothetical protein
MLRNQLPPRELVFDEGFPAQSSMCVGGSEKARPRGNWSGPINLQLGVHWEMPPLCDVLNTTQRCQVPSGWTGPSHLLATSPPYWQPALAGGAKAISPPAVSRAASPPTMPCLIVVPRQIAMTLMFSAEDRLAVGVEQVGFGAALDPWGITTE